MKVARVHPGVHREAGVVDVDLLELAGVVGVELPVVGLGGLVGRVHVEQVQEEEERPLWVPRVDPAQGAVDGVVGLRGALLVHGAVALAQLARELLVPGRLGRFPGGADRERLAVRAPGALPGVPAPLQEEGPLEEGVGVEAAGGVARLRERLRDERAAQRGLAEVVRDAHPVGADEEAGEHAEVRRQGPRGGRERALEEHALGGQAVDARRGRPLVAVAREPVGAQRVDADPDHVRARRPGRRAAAAPEGAGQGPGQSQRPARGPRASRRRARASRGQRRERVVAGGEQVAGALGELRAQRGDQLVAALEEAVARRGRAGSPRAAGCCSKSASRPMRSAQRSKRARLSSRALARNGMTIE